MVCGESAHRYGKLGTRSQERGKDIVPETNHPHLSAPVILAQSTALSLEAHG